MHAMTCPLARTAVLLSLAAPAALSQTPLYFTVPSAGGSPFTTNNLPFAGGPMRYQQVYKAADMGSQVGPVRIKGLWFRGSQNGQQGAMVTMDVRIAHASSFVSSVFENNLGANRLQVLTQAQVQLPSPSSTNWSFNIPFGANEFVWNGIDDIVLDVKIFGNSNGNLPFTYYFDSATAATGSMRRLYTVGNANATVATLDQNGVGLYTRFEYRLGVNVPYGAGCKGLGNFVPEATAVGQPIIPSPNFAFLLARARHQTAVILILGNSRKTFASLPLPFDLSGVGAPGCSLLASMIILVPALTIGGSAGNGTATVSFPLPPFTAFVGNQLFTQWLVVDDSQNAAGFVMSSGLATVIGI
jgi:hypothetical protein